MFPLLTEQGEKSDKLANVENQTQVDVVLTQPHAIHPLKELYGFILQYKLG